MPRERVVGKEVPPSFNDFNGCSRNSALNNPSKTAGNPGECYTFKCACGATLGRDGKCPALCQPVPEPLPKYTGPAVIGLSHTARLGAPVR